MNTDKGKRADSEGDDCRQTRQRGEGGKNCGFRDGLRICFCDVRSVFQMYYGFFWKGDLLFALYGDRWYLAGNRSQNAGP
jgi:hypothetical protein